MSGFFAAVPFDWWGSAGFGGNKPCLWLYYESRDGALSRILVIDFQTRLKRDYWLGRSGKLVYAGCGGDAW